MAQIAQIEENCVGNPGEYRRKKRLIDDPSVSLCEIGG